MFTLTIVVKFTDPEHLLPKRGLQARPRHVQLASASSTLPSASTQERLLSISTQRGLRATSSCTKSRYLGAKRWLLPPSSTGSPPGAARTSPAAKQPWGRSSVPRTPLPRTSDESASRAEDEGQPGRAGRHPLTRPAFLRRGRRTQDFHWEGINARIYSHSTMQRSWTLYTRRSWRSNAALGPPSRERSNPHIGAADKSCLRRDIEPEEGWDRRKLEQ